MVRCIFRGFGLYDAIGTVVHTYDAKKQIWLFLAKNCFQFLAYFRQLCWRNRLDIARCKTTGSGRPYGVGRIVLVCNAYAVTIFWLYFLFIFWLILAAVLALSTWNCQVYMFRLGLYDGIGSSYVTRKKQIWLFLAKNWFKFLAYFRQLFWRNRLDIARCKTTGSGRPYSVGKIVLVCNV